MFTTIVSTAQLAEHLGDWVVVDCRFDLKDEEAGRTLYLAGHIPGAVYAHLGHDLSAPVTGTNGRHPLPTVEAMTSTFAALGISSSSQVVVYDADIGMYASRLWWMLRYLGHEAVAVLDGGYDHWTRERRPVRTGVEHRAPAVFTAAVRSNSLVTLDEMVGGTASAALLIDARASERFEGVHETIDRAAGHIPGAINRFYKDNATDEGLLRSGADLRPTYEGLLRGRSPEDVVAYCGSGVTACHNLLALEHAGLRGARLYVGSWSEWSADPARPIETGPERR